MSSEVRTMGASKGKNASAKGGDGDGADGAPAKKGRKKLLAGVAVLVIAGGAAGWTFYGPGASAEAAEEPEPVKLGDVVVIDPISINLADGHYLKLGMGLQAVYEVEYPPEGSKALDAAISLYSGKPISELSDPEGRKALKDELTKTISEEYHDEVVDVYFREYVMQ